MLLNKPIWLLAALSSVAVQLSNAATTTSPALTLLQSTKISSSGGETVQAPVLLEDKRTDSHELTSPDADVAAAEGAGNTVEVDITESLGIEAVTLAAVTPYVRVYANMKCTGKGKQWKLSDIKSGRCYKTGFNFKSIYITGTGSKYGVAATKAKAGNYCQNYSWTPTTNRCYYWNTVKNGLARSPIDIYP